MNNDISMVLIVAAVVVVLYFLVFRPGRCNLCGKTGSCSAGCLLTQQAAAQVIDSMAIGCVNRLQAVVREDMATVDDVADFMNSGNNRMVMITNVSPDDFVKMVGNKMDNVNAIALSGTILNGKKNYIVMSVAGGTLTTIGAPTGDLSSAFNYLDSAARDQLGADSDNLVFYIDEDIPCPTPGQGTTMLDIIGDEDDGHQMNLPGAEQGVPMNLGPIALSDEGNNGGTTSIETCCGRRD